MCSPSAIALGSLSVLSTGAQYVGQEQRAQAQADYQRRVGKARNQQIALTQQRNVQNLNRQQNAVSQRLRQETESASQQAVNAQRESLRAQGRAQAGAAESGVAGAAYHNLISDIMLQESEFIGSTQRTLGFSQAQSRAQIADARTTAGFRNTSIQPYQPQPINQPSPLGLASGIGSGIFGAYDFFSTQQRRDRQTTSPVTQ